MRWRGKSGSQNVEDRRGERAAGMSLSRGGGGILRLLPVLYRMIGIKGTVLVLVCAGGYGLFTGTLGQVLGTQSLQQVDNSSQSSAVTQTSSEKELVDFVSVILADTETSWSELFKQMGKTYQEPKLVLFRDRVQSACGMAQSATGPFYCPGDRQVYIDLSFYHQLEQDLNAPGDFAQAYVLAHEIGHHVQTLLGTSEQVHRAQSRLSSTEANKLSVKLELQADCFAGVWAHQANSRSQLLEVGDIEEGLTAASAIGDDTLQKNAQGYVRPDSFTHGTSAQRVHWFKTGFDSGEPTSCDTFK
ncbi:KPN_02809 family neutral zinc metallopeptidase [Shewanella violacea]|uniref:Neutral zinc metallopeptidase, putative n=1 Tax=Shewanella violacea (strain JCM 10179 / CIP 106290 / LMG 19151 / DSS12) TaxID=637905 RepID=D4ZLL3_SHEVD|nr:neutral zinc metallopeptidase [Shewanella violacea]BAJ02562.1 neutral zinc metallopeptidase, putative [Shewanella violacea DSS12]